MKKFIITLGLLIAVSSSARAAAFDFSAGLVTGVSPFLGDELDSSFQRDVLDINNGIMGINRSKSGTETKRIYPLFGVNAGLSLRLMLFKRIFFLTGFHYTQSVAGGKGKSLDAAENILDVEYSFRQMDIPLAAGLSVSIFDDARINLAGGFCTAIGKYTNSFSSSAVNSKATFKGVGFPLFITIEAEYFLNDLVGIVSSISYTRGKTDVKKSGIDLAEIDFTGFRWQAGVTLHIRNSLGR